MISTIDLFQIIKKHTEDTGQEFSPLIKNHIIEIVQKAFEHENQGYLTTKYIPTYDEVIKMREDHMKHWRIFNPDYIENDYYSGITDGLFLFYNMIKQQDE